MTRKTLVPYEVSALLLVAALAVLWGALQLYAHLNKGLSTVIVLAVALPAVVIHARFKR